MADNDAQKQPHVNEEKRRAIRISKPLVVQYGIFSGNAVTWDISTVKDISESGICIRTASQMQKSDVCQLRFKMPSHVNEKIEILAKVVNSSSARGNIFTTQLEFLNLDDGQKRILREYVAWCLKSERVET